MINQGVAPLPATIQTWKELYCAALFETDNIRVPARIADAERAILLRARELFAAGTDTIEEDQALDDAPANYSASAGVRYDHRLAYPRTARDYPLLVPDRIAL